MNTPADKFVATLQARAALLGIALQVHRSGDGVLFVAERAGSSVALDGPEAAERRLDALAAALSPGDRLTEATVEGSAALVEPAAGALRKCAGKCWTSQGGSHAP